VAEKIECNCGRTMWSSAEPGTRIACLCGKRLTVGGAVRGPATAASDATEPSDARNDGKKVHIRCPSCNRDFRVKRALMGKSGPCTYCQKSFTITEALIVLPEAPSSVPPVRPRKQRGASPTGQSVPVPPEQDPLPGARLLLRGTLAGSVYSVPVVICALLFCALLGMDTVSWAVRVALVVQFVSTSYIGALIIARPTGALKRLRNPKPHGRRFSDLIVAIVGFIIGAGMVATDAVMRVAIHVLRTSLRAGWQRARQAMTLVGIALAIYLLPILVVVGLIYRDSPTSGGSGRATRHAQSAPGMVAPSLSPEYPPPDTEAVENNSPEQDSSVPGSPGGSDAASSSAAAETASADRGREAYGPAARAEGASDETNPEGLPKGSQAEHSATPLGPPQPEPFLVTARRLFAEGRGREAHAYLLADAVVRGDTNQDVLGTMRWSPGLRRPAFVQRIGLAIDAGATRPAATGSAVSMPGGGKTTDSTDGVIVAWLSAVGQPLMSALVNRIDSGQLGEWLRSTSDSTNVGEPKSGFDAESLTRQSVSVHSGIALFGVVPEEEVVAMGLEQDVDAVLLFRIKVTPPRAGRTANASSLRGTFQVKIIDAANPEDAMFVSRPLDSAKMAAAIADRAEDEPIREFTDIVNKAIDDALVLREIRPLTAELAAKRAAFLASHPPACPLRDLAELRYYQWRTLLTAEQLSTAYTKIVGEDGAKLATGTEEERRTIVGRWLEDGAGTGSISGLWVGELNQQKQVYRFELTLRSNGERVAGTSRIEDASRQFAIMAVDGSFDGRLCQLSEQTILEKNSPGQQWYLKTLTLEYANGKRLTGRWEYGSESGTISLARRAQLSH